MRGDGATGGAGDDGGGGDGGGGVRALGVGNRRGVFFESQSRRGVFFVVVRWFRTTRANVRGGDAWFRCAVESFGDARWVDDVGGGVQRRGSREKRLSDERGRRAGGKG
jgi:hypothetical protein